MSDSMNRLFGDNAEVEEVSEETNDTIEEQVDHAQGEPEQEQTEDEIVEQVREEAEADDRHEVELDGEPSRNEPEMVPVAAKLAMRSKWRDEQAAHEATRREAEQLRQELDALRNPQQSQDPYLDVDPFIDPAAYARLLEERVAYQVQETLYEERAARSQQAAREKYGDEAVNASLIWGDEQLKTNPGLVQQFQHQTDPFDWVVQQHKAATRFNDFNSDEEAYVRRRAAELGLFAPVVNAPAMAATQQPRAETAKPVSITRLPSGGGAVRESDEGEAKAHRIFK